MDDGVSVSKRQGISGVVTLTLQALSDGLPTAFCASGCPAKPACGVFLAGTVTDISPPDGSFVDPGLANLDRLGKPAPPVKRPDNSGKPSLVNPNPPSSPKKQKAPPKSEPAPVGTTTKTPFHRTQNFVVTMVAVTAVSATVIVLALTGHLGGGASRPVGFAKKEKVQPKPVEKTTFKSTERGEIKDMIGKKITVTGDIDRLERDDKGRYLIFKDSDPNRDVMVFFDPATEVSEWVLKRKFAGQKVRATGTVKLDGTRLLLELISMDDLKLHADAPPTGN
jgi:hypothetical protein